MSGVIAYPLTDYYHDYHDKPCAALDSVSVYYSSVPETRTYTVTVGCEHLGRSLASDTVMLSEQVMSQVDAMPGSMIMKAALEQYVYRLLKQSPCWVCAGLGSRIDRSTAEVIYRYNTYMRMRSYISRRNRVLMKMGREEFGSLSYIKKVIIIPNLETVRLENDGYEAFKCHVIDSELSPPLLRKREDGSDDTTIYGMGRVVGFSPLNATILETVALVYYVKLEDSNRQKPLTQKTSAKVRFFVERADVLSPNHHFSR